jgi:hypothetical protein
MRTLALSLLICSLSACSTATWKGHGEGLTPEQRRQDVKDISALASQYESRAYFSDLRRRQMGRANAFGRDLRSIGVTLDRHFFNYSLTDPYVNYESDTGYTDHMLRFALSTVAR